MDQVRTCIGCRSRASRATLTRVVVAENTLRIDPTATAPGRGAWVHPSPECVVKAVERRAFQRALRVSNADSAAVRAYADKLSEAPAAEATAKVDRTMDQS